MTLIHKTGNIFTTKQQAVIHGVNTRGVMGSGIAKEVRRIYPEVYRGYRDHCHSSNFNFVGGDSLAIYGVSADKRFDDKWIFNAASQENPGPSATYEWLEASVTKSLLLARDFRIPGVAIPRIGAGIGGLDWDRVLAILEKVAASVPEVDLEVWTFQP